MAKQKADVPHDTASTIDSGVLFIEEIGLSAGIVWRYLEQQGPVSLFQLKKHCGLSGTQVERAIGWLARENKIEEEYFGSKLLLSHKS